MKARNGQIDFSEMPPYKLGRHWNTIQSYLILGIEDDIGELSEELKMFMEICELLIDERMFDKYWESVADIPDKSQFSRTFRKETALYCLPMASKPMTVTVFGFFTHRFPLFVGF